MPVKRWTSVLLLLLAAAVVAAFTLSLRSDDVATAPTPDEGAVRAALQPYLDGHAAGRGEVMAPAFFEEARLSVVVDGQLHIGHAADYLAGWPGQPAPDEADRQRWVESVTVVGDLALAEIILLHPGLRIVDYMVMHRVDGDWKIVHKAYQREPR